jgi:hypothetical protein
MATDAQILAMLLSGGRKASKAPRKPAARAPFKAGQTVKDGKGNTYTVERCTSKLISLTDRPGYTIPVYFFTAA